MLKNTWAEAHRFDPMYKWVQRLDESLAQNERINFCLPNVEVLVKAGATVEGHPRFGSRTTELVSG